MFCSLFAPFFSFLLVLFLFEEIETDDVFHGSVCVGETELIPAIGIGMNVEHKAGEVFGVVPKEAGAEENIGADVSQDGLVHVVFCDVGLPVANGWEDGYCEDAIVTKGPIVAIPNADGVVFIADLTEQQCSGDALGNVGRQLVAVETDCHMIVGEAEFPRSLTLTLHSILSERCGP